MSGEEDQVIVSELRYGQVAHLAVLGSRAGVVSLIVAA
jgi:hypothetical protein